MVILIMNQEFMGRVFQEKNRPDFFSYTTTVDRAFTDVLS